MHQDICLISYCVSDISPTAPVRTHSNFSVIMSEFVSVSDSVWLSHCVWLCLTWVLLLHKCAHIQIWGINHPQEKPFPWFGLFTLQENLRNMSVREARLPGFEWISGKFPKGGGVISDLKNFIAIFLHLKQLFLSWISRKTSKKGGSHFQS